MSLKGIICWSERKAIKSRVVTMVYGLPLTVAPQPKPGFERQKKTITKTDQLLKRGSEECRTTAEEKPS